MYDFWIDISNTPQVFFFNSILKDLKDHSSFVTARSRGETKALLNLLNVKSKIFGSDSKNVFLKSLHILARSGQLLYECPKFKLAMTLENPMPIPSAKIRRKPIILFLDNDLKLMIKKPLAQRFETTIKKLTTFLVVPIAGLENYSKVFTNSTILSYDGYKEHIYIADYVPNLNFFNSLPFQEYVVLRPESLSSLYVMENRSIVPRILRVLEKENINVIFLPREPGDERLIRSFGNVYLPPEPLNGLDLSYHAKAVLTGSGTMVREAAVLGTTGVSFFPGNHLLAVDSDLIKKGAILHSNDPDEISSHILNNWNRKKYPEFTNAKKAKKCVINILNNIWGEINTDY